MIVEQVFSLILIAGYLLFFALLSAVAHKLTRHHERKAS